MMLLPTPTDRAKSPTAIKSCLAPTQHGLQLATTLDLAKQPGVPYCSHTIATFRAACAFSFLAGSSLLVVQSDPTPGMTPTDWSLKVHAVSDPAGRCTMYPQCAGPRTHCIFFLAGASRSQNRCPQDKRRPPYCRHNHYASTYYTIPTFVPTGQSMLVPPIAQWSRPSRNRRRN